MEFGLVFVGPEDKLQGLLNVPRPKSDEQEQAYTSLVGEIANACQADNDSWKRFLLALLHKRFHLLAPESKNVQSEKGKDGSATPGDGERKHFYLAIKKLLELQKAIATDPDNNNKVQKAIEVLFQLAPFVGGSRDVCHLIEKSIGVICTGEMGKDDLPFAQMVARVIRVAMQNSNQTGLSRLLEFSARQLDQDLIIVREWAQRDEDQA